MSGRRSFLQRGAAFGAALFSAKRIVAKPTQDHRTLDTQVPLKGGYAGNSSASLSFVDSHPGPVDTAPVVTTEVGDLPYTVDGEVKVFRLTAHVFKQQIAPNKTIDVWGFNGSSPGPTIQVRQGDRIRVIYKNELPEPSSIHWHGFEDDISFDGMPGISQELVKPGETFIYNFNIKQEGTFFYHSHMAMQEMAGMLGAFIMHPRIPYRPHCDKDFVIHLQEHYVLPNNTTPNTMNMEFNWLLLNGKAGPAATPLIIRQGDRVRIRFINLGMDHHPMHLHGHTFYVTGTEGGRIPETAWIPGNTVLVGVAQARDVEFVAFNPGDWMLHCHLPHHMMNQMASQVGPMTRMSGADSDSSGPQTIPSAALGAGVEANAPGAPLSDTPPNDAMAGMMAGHDHNQPRMSPLQRRNSTAFDMSGDSMEQQMTEVIPNANNVPNFPQDAFMEGPMMNMERAVDKPENHGLRPNWSRFMQGMMTFVRVLPPARYDEVLAAMRLAKRPRDPYSSFYLESSVRES